jgi:hypothetical protein
VRVHGERRVANVVAGGARPRPAAGTWFGWPGLQPWSSRFIWVKVKRICWSAGALIVVKHAVLSA